MHTYARATLFLMSLWMIEMPAAAGDDRNESDWRSTRTQIVQENPWIGKKFAPGGGFGNRFSPAIANRMYSRTDKRAIADATSMLTIDTVGPRTWVLRFPIVNVAVFETDDGLVLIDASYAPAGPGLRTALEKLSDKPIHTIVLTHYHVDHALGAWALMDQQPKPTIVATDEFVVQQQRDLDLSPYSTRRNHQLAEDAPSGWGDVVAPTRTFTGRLELTVGGTDFVLQAAPGETADQLYVYVPQRQTLITADYYQRFIPNAGNGRRRQRFPSEWADALRDMAKLGARIMIPMHGPVLTNAEEIRNRLEAHADILDAVTKQVIDALNAGRPEYEVARNVELPERFKSRDDVDELYVTVADIARMVLHLHTGWWDDVPSHWNPAPLRAEATEIAKLAGGAQALAKRARSLAAKDIQLAAHLVDWAWLADPESLETSCAAYDIYLQRLRGEGNDPRGSRLSRSCRHAARRIVRENLQVTCPGLQAAAALVSRRANAGSPKTPAPGDVRHCPACRGSSAVSGTATSSRRGETGLDSVR